MAKKYNENSKNFIPPMINDNFVYLDNKEDQKEPSELTELKQRSPFYISSYKGKNIPDIKLSRLSKKKMWGAELGENFILGQLGEDEKALSHPKTKKGENIQIEPYIPKWSGVTYHPKLSEPRNIRPFRRAKNKRVIPHYIFGDDDRQVYFPSGYPWRCIGKVLVWTNPSSTSPAWSGSGVLVGNNVVLTASHVCPWGASPWMMQFIPAFYDGSSQLGNGVNSFVQSYRGYRDHDQGDDMAVLRLYTPLGNSLGWFGSKTYHDSWEDGRYWTKCGYPGAVASAQRPSRITWFPIIDDDNDGEGVELEYRADSSSGDSGGPVFGWWNGSPYVIGTHSGSEEEYQFPFSIIKNNLAAGGSALPNLIIWAHNNW